MKVFSICFIILLLDFTACQSQNNKQNDSINWEGNDPKNYVKEKYSKNFVIMHNLNADINNDKLEDRLLILEDTSSKIINNPGIDAYHLLLFYKMNNGKYKLILQRNNILPPPSSAGNSDHSYDNLVFKNGIFSFSSSHLEHGAFTAYTYYFVYSPNLNAIVLSQIDMLQFENPEDEKGKKIIKKIPSSKRISINEFDINTFNVQFK